MARSARGAWFDPRLLIGVLLVLGSVIGVTWVVAAADRTASVYSAGALLLPGDVVLAEDLQLSSVRLGESAGAYLAPGDIPDAGLVVTRVVAAGELLPASAVADAANIDRAAVVVPLHTPLPGSLVGGSAVELWASPAGEYGRFGAPESIAVDVLLVRTLDQEGFGASGAPRVELLVPRARLPRVLEAIANGDALALVVAGAGPGAVPDAGSSDGTAPGDGGEGSATDPDADGDAPADGPGE